MNEPARNPLPDDIRSFLEFVGPISDLVERVRAEHRRETASGFSAFDYLAVNELGLSRILRDFLDPEGPHGQGDLYLRAFLAKLGLPRTALLDATVTLEETLPGGRRIDLMLRGKDWICGIENKPFAADQTRQLQDYWQYVEAEAGGREARLVYISGYGAGPSEASICSHDAARLREDGSFVVFGYGGPHEETGASYFDEVLEDWERASRPERLRSFLSDFRRHIRNEFAAGGSAVLDAESYGFAQQLIEDDALARQAIRVMQLQPEAQRLLLLRFFAAIEATVLKEGNGKIELLQSAGQWSFHGYEHLSFTLSPATARSSLWRHHLMLAFELPPKSQAFFGLGWQNTPPPEAFAVTEVLKRGFEEHGDAAFAPEGGWPVWWTLNLPTDRLKDVGALGLLHEKAGDADWLLALSRRVFAAMEKADALLSERGFRSS